MLDKVSFARDNVGMKSYRIAKSGLYQKWVKKQPQELVLRIAVRLQRIAEGNFGDHKWFGDIGELRFSFGKGYRLYYSKRLFCCCSVVIKAVKSVILKLQE